MSRRKQSRPQSFKQFLEERKPPNKTEEEDDSDPASSSEAKDEEESGYLGNNMESTIPEEFVIGTDGIVAAAHVTANKVFGPYQGTIVKADPESEKEDNEDKTSCLQITDSDGALYTITLSDKETGYDQQWLTQVAYKLEDANIGIHSQDGKLYLRTLEDIPQGCLIKAIYVKEELQRGIKRQRSNGTYVDHEETPEVNHKKTYIDTPKSPTTLEMNTIQNPLTSSETVVTSSLSAITSSPPLLIKTEAMDSVTKPNNGMEGITETSASEVSVTETETESVAQITHESMDKGPPYNCQHCCIEFRNPDNLEAHRTYYCPTTATQPLPASMRRVPPGANTVIKRRNRTPKQVKEVPYQIRSSTPPSNSTTEEKTLGTYLCQLCQSSFTNHTNCESHMLLLHCDETVNLCKFCNFIAPNLAKLKVHVFTHVKYFVRSVGDSPEPNGGIQGPSAGVLTFRVDGNPNTNKIKLSESEGNKSDNKINQDTPHSGQVSDSNKSIKTETIENQDVPSGSNNRTTPPVRDDDDADDERDQSMEAEKQIPAASEGGSEHQYSCGQCKYETSEKLTYEAHMNQHRLPVLKIPSTKVTPGAFPNVTRIVSPKLDQVEAAANKCHECNIVFMSRQNFVAHKQFYCAGRHSQMSPDLPSQTTVVHTTPVANTRPSEEPSETHPQINSETPTSPKSGRSSSSNNSNIAVSSKIDEPPRTNSSCSSRSTLSPLPTMVQLHGPRPPVSSQSSSPIITSPQPYLIPSGSVLSGVTQQGAPVLLVAVPFPAAAGIRRDDIVPSLPVTSVASAALAEEEKPLDLSVKTSRSSPEASSSTSRMADTPPRSMGEGSQTAAVIDLASMAQSNLRSPPPQIEQLNECKKCDIVFNKYESLLAHKQYYCASRHLRGRQIEMSYRQNVTCSTSQASGPHMNREGESENKAQSDSEQPTSSNHSEVNNHISHAEIGDSDGKGAADSVDPAPMVIKQEQEKTLSEKISTAKSATSSETGTKEDEATISSFREDKIDQKSEPKEIDPSISDTNLLGLKFKSPAKQYESPDDREQMTSDESSRKHGSADEQNIDKDEAVKLNDTMLPQRPRGSHNASLELSKQIPRPYSCPACTVSFMKFESLDVHQKFYCAARNVSNSPQPVINIPKVVPVPAIPEIHRGDDNSITPSGHATPQRDSLFCKGCEQYFATSKQVRRHSCKNGANQSNLAQKRSSPEQNVSNDNRTNMVDVEGPPSKRCKNESVLKVCLEVGKEETNGVVIKQEYVDRSYCGMSSHAASNNEQLLEKKRTEEEHNSNQDTNKQLLTKIKCEDESEMSASCHNGNGPNNKENNTGLTSCIVSNNQSTVISAHVTIKDEKDGNSPMCSDNVEKSNSQHNIIPSAVTVTTICSDSLIAAARSITTVAADTRLQTSGHFRVTSGANLSGRSRVIQQPPAKHCSTCNIDFNSLSNFIAHKKFYCSARQHTKS
ncbi:LOW QUALITY PROTEIN: uncharacterized protein [Amphiura filiformis]|uniref:LOW QUALITY PROTEIN: uncharacterized protein n=1 Tax=Amphiura filiformis TaxID=82378 RepID=UPI003B20E056